MPPSTGFGVELHRLRGQDVGLAHVAPSPDGIGLVTNGLSNQRITALTESFLAADFRWELDREWLRLHVGETSPELDAAYPNAARFGVLSAANPAQVMRSEIDNRSADHSLQSALDRLGLPYRAAFVSASNRGWKAYNWLLIDPPVDTFDELSRKFGQIGTLLWPRGAKVRLRMDARPPPGFGHHPDIDWIGGSGTLLETPTSAETTFSK